MIARLLSYNTCPFVLVSGLVAKFYGGVHILYNADGVGGWVEVLLYFVIYGGGWF